MGTIYALASGSGKSGVAVVRVSGPQSHKLCRVVAGGLPAARQASLRSLVDGQGGLIDEALVLRFDRGHSFTGEDSVEFQVHGSTATVQALFARLSEFDDVRLAEPGEFTRRALENGCLDLTQVEGLADLIDAETEAQRQQALRVLSGALGDKADGWRVKLIRAAALLEATIDFADEDVPVDVTPEVMELIEAVEAELHTEASGSHISERIRSGFEVAIVGVPNAGKSTLLNALAGREAAITSEYAGTTRDVIEVRMDLRGLPVTVLDTAGLRDTDDHVESIGIERAIARARAADLRVFLLSDQDVQGIAPVNGDISVQGKSDISGAGVSGKTGQGVEDLVKQISSRLSVLAQGAATATHERHRVAISQGLKSLAHAKVEVIHGPDRAEFAAEELRRVVRRLDSLVGRIDTENLLDEIFASFCLGK